MTSGQNAVLSLPRTPQQLPEEPRLVLEKEAHPLSVLLKVDEGQGVGKRHGILDVGAAARQLLAALGKHTNYIITPTARH